MTTKGKGDAAEAQRQFDLFVLRDWKLKNGRATCPPPRTYVDPKWEEMFAHTRSPKGVFIFPILLSFKRIS